MPPAEPARLPALTTAEWFAEHVQPHEPALRAYLSRRFPSLPDHDDLVQETYARLLRVRDPARLAFARAFLFTTARNAAIDLFRRNRRVVHEPIDETHDFHPLDEPAGIIESLERQQRLEALLEAISALPDRCREVMMLRYLDGFTVRQIAGRLGIAFGTVKNHLLKGVYTCSRHFERRGLVDSTTPPPDTVA
jgi:RNA polymerase sigma-70 factor (ECF subfamily)